MASVADSRQAYPPPSWDASKAPIHTQISFWIGLAALVGWALSRFSRQESTNICSAEHAGGQSPFR
jgi:hypothetical protein